MYGVFYRSAGHRARVRSIRLVFLVRCGRKKVRCDFPPGMNLDQRVQILSITLRLALQTCGVSLDLANFTACAGCNVSTEFTGLQ